MSVSDSRPSNQPARARRATSGARSQCVARKVSTGVGSMIRASVGYVSAMAGARWGASGPRGSAKSTTSGGRGRDRRGRPTGGEAGVAEARGAAAVAHRVGVAARVAVGNTRGATTSEGPAATADGVGVGARVAVGEARLHAARLAAAVAPRVGVLPAVAVREARAVRAALHGHRLRLLVDRLRLLVDRLHVRRLRLHLGLHRTGLDRLRVAHDAAAERLRSAAEHRGADDGQHRAAAGGGLHDLVFGQRRRGVGLLRGVGHGGSVSLRRGNWACVGGVAGTPEHPAGRCRRAHGRRRSNSSRRSYAVRARRDRAPRAVRVPPPTRRAMGAS